MMDHYPARHPRENDIYCIEDDGLLFWFEVVSATHVELAHVEIPGGCDVPGEDYDTSLLPRGVRVDLAREGYRPVCNAWPHPRRVVGVGGR